MHRPEKVGFVGMDVSKPQLDVAQRLEGAERRVPDTDAGITEVVSWLLAVQPTLLVLEATSGWERAVVRTLVAGAARRVPPSIEAHLAWLKTALQQMDADLDRLIQAHPRFQVQEDLLRSTPGVGRILSRTMLGGRAGVGHPESQADCGLGRRGPAQSGQWDAAGQTDHLGWTGLRPGRLIHGHVGGRAALSRDPRLL